MLPTRSFSPVATALAAFVVAGCQTLPTPATPDSAMAVLYMTVTVSDSLSNESPAQVVIGKVDSAGGVEKEVKQTGAYGNYVMFANLEPGKYKVLRAVRTERSAGGGPMAPVGGGFAVGLSFTPPPVTIEFGPDVVQHTLVEVPASAVAYMGDFSATVRWKSGFPPKYEAGKSVGQLTEGGKRRAYETLQTLHPDSPWVLKLKPPVFGVAVDELTAELKVKSQTDKGVLVLAVGRNSPASEAGIQSGAVVTRIGDKLIANRRSYDEALDQYAGKTATVTYFRYDGERYEGERLVEVRFNEKMQ